MKIVLTGRVASKKNSKRLVKVGGRVIPISSKSWKAFEKKALEEIEPQIEEMLSPPYKVDYVFYMRGKGGTDIDNMMAGINDIVEKAGAIENDKDILEVKAKKIIQSKDYITLVNIQSKA